MDAEGLFKQHKVISILDIPEFDRVCMQFKFVNSKDGKPTDSMLFVRQDQIFEYNFETEVVKTIYCFKSAGDIEGLRR